MKNKEVIDHIVNWLKDYSDRSGTHGFVIGVSGGIDSALTSTLCAMTGKKVIVLNMPIRQFKKEFDLSSEHIKWLEAKFRNVESYVIELTRAFDTFELSVPEEVRDFLSMANSRARLRMTTLYAFACHHKFLVAGTGNKIEDFGVGFFTKYGDGGVDLSPIADLVKSEVYSLAKELGVPQNILWTRPTDGLFADGRTDEDQLGASYDELEWAMNVAEKNLSEENLNERQRTVLAIFKKLNRANQHKMQPIPVCRIPPELKA
jgi:NAD+ synthase